MQRLESLGASTSWLVEVENRWWERLSGKSIRMKFFGLGHSWFVTGVCAGRNAGLHPASGNRVANARLSADNKFSLQLFVFVTAKHIAQINELAGFVRREANLRGLAWHHHFGAGVEVGHGKTMRYVE